MPTTLVRETNNRALRQHAGAPLHRGRRLALWIKRWDAAARRRVLFPAPWL
jgi:hypothetical protein